MTPAEIIAQAYSIIDDPDGTIPPAEMEVHLQDVALHFSTETKVMRTKQGVAYFAGRSVLTLPEDCHEIIRAIDSQGNELDVYSKADLPSRWEQETSALPTGYIRDFTGPEQITLYPSPTAGSTLTLYYVQQHVIGGDILIPSRYHLSLVYGLASKALARSPNPEDQEKLARFGAAYAEGIAAAQTQASKNFSSHTRRVRSHSF